MRDPARPAARRRRRRRPTPRPAPPARSQVRTVDRSERIRTYNFPENRIADHRVGYKAYNLDQVLDGDLDAVMQSCADADMAAPARRRRRRAERCTDAACAARPRTPPGWPRPGSRAPSTTPSAGRARARHRRAPAAAARRLVDRRERARLRAASSRAARPASRCSTSPARRAFRYLELAVGPGRVRAAARDRGRRRVGDRRAAPGVPRPGRGRPVHRLRRDRAGHRPRGARGRGARRRGRPEAATPGPRRNLAGDRRRRPAHGDVADALRRPRRHGRPGGQQPAVHPASRRASPSSPRCASTTRAPRLWSAATTAWTPSACVERTARRLLRPGGLVVRRARRRAGRAAAGGLRRHRALDRGPGPPGPGRPPPLRHGAAGTMTLVSTLPTSRSGPHQGAR